MKTLHTVLKMVKEVSLRKVREKRDLRMSLVMIFLETEGEPKIRLAPSRARVTEREVVGEER